MNDENGEQGEPTWLAATRTSYGVDAAGYGEKIHGLLESRPLLRAHLDVFAELVERDGGFRIVSESALRPDDEIPGALVLARRRK